MSYLCIRKPIIEALWHIIIPTTRPSINHTIITRNAVRMSIITNMSTIMTVI